MRAGVGTIGHSDDTVFQLQAVAYDFKEAVELGRAMHYACACGEGGNPISIFNIHGYFGGHQSSHKANGINNSLQATIQELMHFEGMPHLIVGDFNLELKDFSATWVLIFIMNLVDEGAVSETWGQPKNATTCQHMRASPPGEIVLACPVAFPFITNFRVAMRTSVSRIPPSSSRARPTGNALSIPRVHVSTWLMKPSYLGMDTHLRLSSWMSC